MNFIIGKSSGVGARVDPASKINNHISKEVLDHPDRSVTEQKLSTELQTKINNAESNVQPDWSQTDNTKDDFIKNKPTIPTDLADLQDDSTHRTVTDTEKSTWNGKEAGGTVSTHNSSETAHADIRGLFDNYYTETEMNVIIQKVTPSSFAGIPYNDYVEHKIYLIFHTNLSFTATRNILFVTKASNTSDDKITQVLFDHSGIVKSRKRIEGVWSSWISDYTKDEINAITGTTLLTSLTTTIKTSLVNAINWLYGIVGDVTTLTTTYKNDIVGAINELVNVKQNKPITTTVTVDTPIFTNQPTISGNLDASFKIWNEEFYFVTLKEMATTVTQTNAVFTTTTIIITETSATFSIGNEISIGGCSIIANNKTATITNVSNNGVQSTYTFAASTFTAGTSTTIINMGTMTNLPSGQFKLMLWQNSPASAINQIFTLTNLATGNSGTLAENSRVDFKTLNVVDNKVNLRLRDVLSLDISLTGNLQTKDFKINVTGEISKTNYFYFRILTASPSLPTVFSASGVSTGYSGGQALFPPATGQTKKFIQNDTFLSVIRNSDAISYEFKTTHSGSDTMGGNATFTNSRIEGRTYAVNGTSLNTTALQTIRLAGGTSLNDMCFANGTIITLKEIL